MMCDPQKDCRIQVFEYDGSGQQEEKRNIGLRIGLKKTQWVFQFGPPLGKPSTGFSESDVGKPPDIECDVGRMLDELVSSELATTKLTDDEVRIDSCLNMDSTRFQLCQN